MDLPEVARVGSLILLAITVIIVRRAYMSDRELVPLGIIALVVGLAFEYRRIFRSWRSLLYMFLAMYAVSLTAFIPLEGNKPYDVESRIEWWPYWFCFLVALGAMTEDRERITARMDEGTVLLIGLAVGYWLFSHWSPNVRSGFDMFVLMLYAISFAFVALHAFTERPLGRSHRLLLSLLGTCGTLLLALDNIWRVWAMEPPVGMLSSGLHLLAYFLLGISSMYIVNNAYLLMDLMPDRGATLSSYRKELKVIKKLHVSRFDSHQVPSRYALYCVIYSLALYIPNALFEWVPVHMAIWGVVVTFPLLLHGFVIPRR